MISAAKFIDRDISKITILPTEKCNLRCTYCYESHKLGRMSADVQQRVKRFLTKNIPGKKALYLSWFGGEPLLEKDIVLDISGHAWRVCNSTGASMEMEITTNGMFVDSATLDSLAQMGRTTFQITLDGPKEAHNLRRIGPNGAETFDLIIDAVRRIIEHRGDFFTVVRVHYDEDTANHIVEFSRWASSLVGDRGRVFVRPVARLLGTSKEAVKAASSEVVSSVKKELAALADADSEEEHVCYAALPNSLVIRQDGTISKCTVALDDGRNRVGHIDEDGSILLGEHFQKWMAGWYSGRADILRCPLAHVIASEIA